jgi:hypothetical protein
VTKPINPQELVATLAAWIQPLPQGNARSAPILITQEGGPDQSLLQVENDAHIGELNPLLAEFRYLL